MICPFNTLEYASGLSNLGTSIPHHSGKFHLIKQAIPGSNQLFDGFGGIPYLWIENQEELRWISEDFRDLVSITLVTQPGFIPDAKLVDNQFLKYHFVFDPAEKRTELSSRARRKLEKCRSEAEFLILECPIGKMKIEGFYRLLQLKKKMLSPFENLPRSHFEFMAFSEAGIFFETRNQTGTGSMACGIIYKSWLQLMHTVTTDAGLTWNSSYFLMDEILNYCEKNQLKLSMGGLPRSHTPGLETFKDRWTNKLLPVFLTKIINQPQQYQLLSTKIPKGTAYFPAYRAEQKP